MRKDVKRSLLLWPAAASVTITAVSWFPTQMQREFAARPQLVASRAVPSPIKLLVTESDAVSDQIEVVARQDHGNRGLRMPDRVATAFGVATPVLKAPIRDRDQELAGLALRSKSIALTSGWKTTRHQTEQDLSEAKPDVTGQENLARIRSIRDEALRQRHQIDPPPSTGASEVRTAEKFATAAPRDRLRRVPPSQPTESASIEETAPIETADLQPPARTLRSVLPLSNRLLARRELDADRSDAVDSAEDAAVDSSGADVESDAASAEPTSALPWQTPQLPELASEFPGVASELPESASDLAGEALPLPEQQSGSLRPSDLDGSAPAMGSVGDISPVHPWDRGLLANTPEREAAPDAIRDPLPTASGNSPAGWPVTTKLDQQLELLSAMALNARPARRDRLASHTASASPVTEWTSQVSDCLLSLRSLSRLGDDQAGELIGRLEALAIAGNRQAEQVEDRAQQVQWLCTAYAVRRRVAVWKLVWAVSRGDRDWMVGDLSKYSLNSLEGALEAVQEDLVETGDVAGWNQYLLLDEIHDNRVDLDRESRKIVAQRFLSRLQWHRLSPEQQRWLERPSVSSLAEAVRPWAQDAVDYAQLMHEIEVQETDAIDLVSLNLASAVQTLRYADNPAANQIADAIDTHYRNANLRLALSDDLLDRLIPKLDPQNVPVRSRVLGSQVRGHSQVDSNLGIQLIPSSDRWNLLLHTRGNVTTRSTGSRSMVAVHTLGQSQFEAGTAIQITKRGVELDDTNVKVHGRTKLRSIETDLDAWPLLGPLARSLAENRYRSMAPEANRIANRTLQQRIESEIEETIQARSDRASEQLSEVVLGPLSSLKLDPQVTDMQTTNERLLARFRLAGDWQMAAFTPRPRAPRSSLMSAQVHQSAFNNTIEQLLPRGEATSIETMLANIATTFGQQGWNLPEDIPSDVTIQFASTRPVTVEIEGDRLWITLRIVRLRRPGSVDLTNFIVRAAYKPQVEGIKASLVRDGHLRISGPRMSMRERLPARTIFNKVLSSNREIPLVLPRLQQLPAMEGLAVSQLELRDGWLAIAISESDAPRIALAP